MSHSLSAAQTVEERIARDNAFLAWSFAPAWTPADIERLFEVTMQLIRRDAGIEEAA